MRTTIEISDEHRSRLLELAARRGEKGFSRLVAEALDAYLRDESSAGERRRRALTLRGSLSDEEGEQMLAAAQSLRESWR